MNKIGCFVQLEFHLSKLENEKDGKCGWFDFPQDWLSRPLLPLGFLPTVNKNKSEFKKSFDLPGFFPQAIENAWDLQGGRGQREMVNGNQSQRTMVETLPAQCGPAPYTPEFPSLLS